MCDRNVKSEYILMKLSALVSECICERTAKFHEEILYMIAELLIFKYRWQNISVSNTSTCPAIDFFTFQARHDSIARTSYTATCLAGWVSVTRRYSIKTARPKSILKLFQPSESSIILVSNDSCTDTQFQGDWGTPSAGGVKCTGWEKLAIFVRHSTEIAVYLSVCF